MKKPGCKIKVTKDIAWRVLRYKEQNPNVSMEKICKQHGFSFMHLRNVINRHKNDSDYDQLISLRNRVIKQGGCSKITLEMLEETVRELESNPYITRQIACQKRGFSLAAFRYTVKKYPDLKLRMKNIRSQRTERKVHKDSVDQLINLLRETPMLREEACQKFGFSLTTLYGYLAKNPEVRKLMKAENLGYKKYLPQ